MLLSDPATCRHMSTTLVDPLNASLDIITEFQWWGPVGNVSLPGRSPGEPSAKNPGNTTFGGLEGRLAHRLREGPERRGFAGRDLGGHRRQQRGQFPQLQLLAVAPGELLESIQDVVLEGN